MRNIILSGIGATVASVFIVQVVVAASEFEAFKQQQMQEFQQSKDEFKEYRKDLLAAFDRYRKQTSAVWGKRNNIMPDKTRWVSYPGDLSNRSVVDFETGIVDVAVAVEIDKQIADKVARARLQKTVQAAMQQGADKRPMSEIARRPVSRPVGEPVLRNLIAGADGNALDTSAYDKFSASVAGKAKRETVRGDDGKQRYIYRAQFHLVSDQIKQRAQRYRKQVDNHAETHKIPSAVVLAVMETESMFNPTARSAAPAFGLMQLVPTSGARDAYRYLYKQDRIVTDTYLYNPDNNIQLGTAYLNRLYHGYLAGITRPEARLWASIAAYNTGPGNVFRTFAGSYSNTRFGSRSRWKQIALKEINKRSPEQVYAFLRSHLPYAETRDYVKKVRERIPKYQAL